jgi:hypothetical protein
MAPAKELADLATQKRMLIAESEACRIALAADLGGVIAPLRWVDRIRLRGRPALWLGLPLVGYLLRRRLASPTRWVALGLGALRAVLSVKSFLGSRRKR